MTGSITLEPCTIYCGVSGTLLLLLLLAVLWSSPSPCRGRLIMARASPSSLAPLVEEQEDLLLQSGGKVGTVVRAAGHAVREYHNVAERQTE